MNRLKTQEFYDQFCISLSKQFPFIKYTPQHDLYLSIGKFVEYEIDFDLDVQKGYGYPKYDLMIFNFSFDVYICLEINTLNSKYKSNNRATINCSHFPDFPDESFFILLDNGFEITEESMAGRDIIRKWTLRNIINGK